jgi:hypothetical protein
MNKVFTEIEAVEIKQKIATLTRVNDGNADWIWSLYNKVIGGNENRPCTCGSAAKHWEKAIKTINEHLKLYDGR